MLVCGSVLSFLASLAVRFLFSFSSASSASSAVRGCRRSFIELPAQAIEQFQCFLGRQRIGIGLFQPRDYGMLVRPRCRSLLARLREQIALRTRREPMLLELGEPLARGADDGSRDAGQPGHFESVA